MTIEKIRPLGWAAVKVATHQDFNAIDDRLASVIDGRDGYTDTVRSELTFLGNGAIILGSGGDFTAGSGSNVSFASGSTTTFHPGASFDVDGYVDVNSGGGMYFWNGSTVIFQTGSQVYTDGYNTIRNGGNLVLASGSKTTAKNGSLITLDSGSTFTGSTGATVTFNDLVTFNWSGIRLTNNADVSLGTGAEIVYSPARSRSVRFTPSGNFMPANTSWTNATSYMVSTALSATCTTCINEFLIDGATLASLSVELYITGTSRTPANKLRFRIERLDNTGTPTRLYSGVSWDATYGTYNARHTQTFVTDQNNVIDRTNYTYFLMLLEESSTNAVYGNQIYDVIFNFTNITTNQASF